MWRSFLVALLWATSASAQVLQEDNSILDQLTPESFQLSATATAAGNGPFWNTTVSYTLVNNSGMNLFFGIDRYAVSLGSCHEVGDTSSGLPLLPSPGRRVYSSPIGAGTPRGIIVLAGARITGTVLLSGCSTPNPGFPTAPLSLPLMLGKQAPYLNMQVFPLSANTPIRQIRSSF